MTVVLSQCCTFCYECCTSRAACPYWLRGSGVNRGQPWGQGSGVRGQGGQGAGRGRGSDPPHTCTPGAV